MSKILVILTGGTIGSSSKENVLDSSENSCREIINLYNKHFTDSTEFDVINPIITLSENMTMEKWEIIINCIRENLDKSYKGIIVTHGSDTLSYTSNLAGILFNSSATPIVFTASNKELADTTGNGLMNFRNAVLFINQYNGNGVFVSYSNNHDDGTIYDATNIVEADNFNDNFSSYDGKIFAQIKNEKLKILTKLREENYELKDSYSFKNKVLLMRPYVGLDYSNISLDGVSAVVHYLYHSSTACTDGNGNSILNLIEKCEKNNIKFFIAPIKKDSEKRYASLDEILKYKNVSLIYDSSPERAYAIAITDVN